MLGLTWEFSLVGSVFSLSNGGTAGAIWLTFVVCCGMCTVMLSMAEMASMAPTSGGETKIVADLHAVADTGNCQDNITGYPNLLLAACKSSSHSLSVGFVLWDGKPRCQRSHTSLHNRRSL